MSALFGHQIGVSVVVCKTQIVCGEKDQDVVYVAVVKGLGSGQGLVTNLKEKEIGGELLMKSLAPPIKECKHSERDAIMWAYKDLLDQTEEKMHTIVASMNVSANYI